MSQNPVVDLKATVLQAVKRLEFRTMTTLIENLKQAVKSRPRRVIFPEQQDSRVIEAARHLKQQGLAEPIILATDAAVDGQLEIFAEQPNHRELFQTAINRLVELRAQKGMTPEQADKALQNPLLLAAVLVNIGYADAGIAGSLATTAEVFRAGIQGIGLAADTELVSSFFLMELNDGRVLTFADCAVIAQPNAEQLAEIAIASAASHQRITQQEPCAALLSFSTLGSAEHDCIDKVRSALAIARQKQPQLNIDGELQFDAAFVPEVAARKAASSDVAGRANVYIFPSLDAGNIAYKIVERIGRAKAIGPILQGLAKPWMDLSRGCSSEDIVNVAVIASLLAS